MLLYTLPANTVIDGDLAAVIARLMGERRDELQRLAGSPAVPDVIAQAAIAILHA